jgi:hypothetical protein
MSTVYKYCDNRGVDILKKLELKIKPANQFNEVERKNKNMQRHLSSQKIKNGNTKAKLNKFSSLMNVQSKSHSKIKEAVKKVVCD